MIVKKREKKLVTAVCLGTGHPLEQQLAREGKLRKISENAYLIFTRESSSLGEIAEAGDYVKLDQGGMPYPNEKDYFEANHVAAEAEGSYYQIPQELEAWYAREPENDTIRFLRENEMLRIDKDDPERFFSAFLWGAEQTAPQDAVVIFDSVTRDGNGTVTAVEFHFIVREEFNAAYLEVTEK